MHAKISHSISLTRLNLTTRRIFTRQAPCEAVHTGAGGGGGKKAATLNPFIYPVSGRVAWARPQARDRKLRKTSLLSIQLICDPRQDCTFPNLMYPGLQPLPLPCLQRGLWDNTIPCRQNARQCDVVSHLATLLLLGNCPLCFKGPFLFREKQ